MSGSSSHRRYPRAARVNELLREVIAEEVERLSDPRLGFVTVTGVEVTGDLQQATVFYSILAGADGGRTGADPSRRPPARADERGPDAAAETAAALESARPHLQSVIGRQVRLRYVPRLHFAPDEAIARGQRIEEILRDIHRQEGVQ